MLTTIVNMLMAGEASIALCVYVCLYSHQLMTQSASHCLIPSLLHHNKRTFSFCYIEHSVCRTCRACASKTAFSVHCLLIQVFGQHDCVFLLEKAASLGKSKAKVIKHRDKNFFVPAVFAFCLPVCANSHCQVIKNGGCATLDAKIFKLAGTMDGDLATVIQAWN